MIKGNQFYLIRPTQYFIDLLPESEIGEALKEADLLNIDNSDYLIRNKLVNDFIAVLFLLKLRKIIHNSEDELKDIHKKLLELLTLQNFEKFFLIEHLGYDWTTESILENIELCDLNGVDVTNSLLLKYFHKRIRI